MFKYYKMNHSATPYAVLNQLSVKGYCFCQWVCDSSQVGEKASYEQIISDRSIWLKFLFHLWTFLIPQRIEHDTYVCGSV